MRSCIRRGGEYWYCNCNRDSSENDTTLIAINSVSAMPQTNIQSQNLTNETRHFLMPLEKGVKEEDDNEEKPENDSNACTKNVNRIEYQNENKNVNEDENEDKRKSRRNESENDNVLGRYEFVTVKTEEQSGDEQEISKSIMSSKLETISVSTTKTIFPQFIKKHSVPDINGMSEIRIRSLKMLQNLIQTPKNVQNQICNNNVSISPEAPTMATIKKENEFSLSDNGIKSYPKPAYSYSCLIAMAIKNSPSGTLMVSEIYNFICHHFPYFKTAPNGWKNSIRYNLSSNKWFVKCPKIGSQQKSCRWTIAPAKVTKIDEELQKWSKEESLSIKRAMIHSNHLTFFERGKMKYLQNTNPKHVFIDTESSSDEEGTSFEESIHDRLNANSVTNNYVKTNSKHKDMLLEQQYITKNERFKYEFGPCTKRRKILSSTIHKKHMYNPGRAATSAPLLLRTSIANCSFINID